MSEHLTHLLELRLFIILKKILSILLCAVFVCAMAVPVFAEDAPSRKANYWYLVS